MSLLQGLNIVKEKGLGDCIIEGDSEMVVSWGVRQSWGSWKLINLVWEIRDLIAELQVEVT